MRAGRYQMFAIVKYEQKFLRLKGLRERVQQRATWLLREAKRRDDLLWDKHRISQGRYLNPPHTVLKFWQEIGRHLQSQARLTRATSSGEGQQASGGKEVLEFGNRTFTTNEATQLD